MSFTRPALLLVAAFMLQAIAPAHAADVRPGDIIKQVYTYYIGKGKGVPQGKEPAFSKRLAEAAKAEAKASEGEVGAIDFDPYVEAQDWQIKSVDVKEIKQGPKAAVVIATFSNMKQEETVAYLFINENNKWVIDDIVWPDQESSYYDLVVTAVANAPQ